MIYKWKSQSFWKLWHHYLQQALGCWLLPSQLFQKGYGQFALTLGQSFSWGSHKHSLHRETEVNPTYFHHLGLRCFSHLLHTCQNQCNKKVWGGFFFLSDWLTIHWLRCILTNERPTFLQGMQAKSTWSAISSFSCMCNEGLEGAHCMNTNVIWLFTCSENQSQNVLSWFEQTGSSVHLQKSSALQELMSLLGHHRPLQKCAGLQHVWH